MMLNSLERGLERQDVTASEAQMRPFSQLEEPESSAPIKDYEAYLENTFTRAVSPHECAESNGDECKNSTKTFDNDFKYEKNVRAECGGIKENDGVKQYYDDHGNEYREGDDLKPNCTYEINGYTYETDENGRIVSASGNLHMKDREGRLPIRDSIEAIGKGDQQEGDDRGHLIGDQFDGSNGLENMIPQDADINRNDFKQLENELAKEVRSGKEVFVEVTPIYEGDSRRPSGVMVTYIIDGETSTVVFPNGRE